MAQTDTVSAHVQEAARCIASARRILAVTHINPDGDAIGCLVALGHIAAVLGIEARLYCVTPVPEQYLWLRSPAPVIRSLEELGSWRPDRVIFLDCADDRRPGDEMAAFIAACRAGDERCEGIQTLCIDHHIANPGYADINWVDPTMSATGVMVAMIAEELRIPLDNGLGEALYLAIVSDTGGFGHSNTNAAAMRIAADIVGNGLDVGEFSAKYENNWTLNRMHLWGDLLRDVTVLCDGKIAVSVVDDSLLLRHEATPADFEGYVAMLRRLVGTKVSIFAYPARGGSKVSLRSMGDVDVQQIALAFGGGGHKAAAGADVPLPPREATRQVYEAVCQALNVVPDAFPARDPGR